MAWVELVSVTKRFGSVVALDGVNLTVEKGEFFTLLGPSGCGKTTTLRIIAGLEYPTSGRVFIAGEDVTNRPPGSRNVAMVFQNYALYPHMTVFQNIAYPLVIRKVNRSEIRERVEYIAKNLQIIELLERYPMEISGGQQQRVALARAIIQTPSVFLLDEPLSNLDAKLRIEARGFLKRLHMDLGATVIYVTHDQSEAMALSTRMAVMDSGRVRQVGTPKEIYERPADTFVAQFIGNPPMNVVSVKWDGRRIEFEGQYVDVPPGKWGILGERNRTLLLGIRPEHVVLGSGPLRGEVYVVEPLGVESVVTLKTGNTTLKALVFGDDFRGEPGDTISFNLRWEKIVFFDEEGRLLS